MSDDPTTPVQAFRFQASACAGFGSSFSAAVLSLIADGLATETAYAELMSPWRGKGMRALVEAAAPLRLLGGLHYLVLAGLAPDLAAHYPPVSLSLAPDRLAPVLRATIMAHQAVLARFMEQPPQTNEVRRSICLVGGFLTVAARTGLPLRCLELGASAGLNQNWDLYRYRFGDTGAWGDPNSPVQIDTDWSGPPPPDAAVRIVERLACDRHPIDLTDPDLALRLQAYVWPDQQDRLNRLRDAIALAKVRPPRIDVADAAAWTEARFAPRAGTASVLYHSVVWQYFPESVRERVTAAVLRAGRGAKPDSPVAWLRMEPSEREPLGPMEVRLNVWPGGEDRLLTRVHPHGAKVVWAGA